MSLTRRRNATAACLATSAIVGALAGMCFALVTPAAASIRDSKDRLTWSASAYAKPNFEDATAPLQIVFRDESTLSYSRVLAHLQDGWLGMDRRTNKRCTRPRHIAFPSPKGDSHLWAASSLYVSTNTRLPCLSQAHGRIFLDYQHASQYNHEPGEYYAANFHLDRTDIESRCTGSRRTPICSFKIVDHEKPAESGQASRRRALRKMSRGSGADHCRDFNYVHNPLFKPGYYGADYDGWIGRISLAHEAAAGGC